VRKACAFVVLKPGETLAFEELIAFLRQQRIATFKLPERLEVVAELPLSPVGQDPEARAARDDHRKIGARGPASGGTA
jgi:non-ribosomal peptide synthetase component E (peptide arylation enzyme)